MKRFTGLLISAIFVLLAFSLSSCTYEDPVYYEGGNADIESDLLTVPASAWLVNSQAEFQWYQEFTLSGPALSTDGMIVAYILNSNQEWECLPMSSLLWYVNEFDEEILYSEEMWYSFTDDGGRFVVEFRNTHPVAPTPPASDLTLKIYFVDRFQYQKIKEEQIDLKDHSVFVKALKKYDIKPKAIKAAPPKVTARP